MKNSFRQILNSIQSVGVGLPLICLLVILLFSCKGDKPATKSAEQPHAENAADLSGGSKEQTPAPAPGPETSAVEEPETPATKEAIPDTWVEMTGGQGFSVDIRYATSNNFTKKKIYDCGRCYLRPEAAGALMAIQAELKETHGYSIKLFDCFRPRPYQQRLWDAVPDPDYVTPPAKGSMHSRGLAVDLTIADKNGRELDMGTEYDFFGEEAHQDFKGLNPEVAKNRQLLKGIMEKHGFNSIRTEWWHYSYGKKSYPLDNWVWPCR